MSGTEKVTEGLDAIIKDAVSTRIEAEVIKALAGDEFIGRMVASALQQQVEVPDPNRSYGKMKVPFLTHTIQTTIRSATEAAVKKVVAEEADAIEEQVRRAVKREAAAFAEGVTSSLLRAAESNYRVGITVKLPGQD